MGYLGYSIKVPDAALLGFGKRFCDILWVVKLGKYEDDIKLRGVKLQKIAEGWRYEVRDRRGKELSVREVHGKTYTYREPREGDYYVKFADASYEVMNKGLLNWHRRKYQEQLERDIANDPKAQEILRILNENKEQDNEENIEI